MGLQLGAYMDEKKKKLAKKLQEKDYTSNTASKINQEVDPDKGVLDRIRKGIFEKSRLYK